MKEVIRLLFSGDFAPLDNPRGLGSNPFKAIHEIISKVDAHITNLECPLTDHNHEISKTGPALKEKPESISLLKKAGVSIACLANNHIFDYGETGITDTIKVCREHEIETLGIVNRTDEQPHWLISEIKGKKIGLLNYCEHEFSVRGPRLLGACGYDPVYAFYDINKLRTITDFLIVIYHGGSEYVSLPSPELKKNFHYLADLGVDAVIGHHTHVFSGVEIYKGKPLVYSLGNFFFPLENEPESWNLGLLCLLNISDKIEIELHPVKQSEKKMKVSLLEEEKLSGVREKINRLSGIISDDKMLRLKWDEYSEKMSLGYLKQFPCLSRPFRVLLKLGFPISLFLSKKRLRNFKNILDCQSHSELLKNSMKKELNK